jgi:hypothetical protein
MKSEDSTTFFFFFSSLINNRLGIIKRNGNSQADLFFVGMNSIEEMRAGREGKGWRWNGATRLNIGNLVGIRESEYGVKNIWYMGEGVWSEGI